MIRFYMLHWRTRLLGEMTVTRVDLVYGSRCFRHPFEWKMYVWLKQWVMYHFDKSDCFLNREQCDFGMWARIKWDFWLLFLHIFHVGLASLDFWNQILSLTLSLTPADWYTNKIVHYNKIKVNSLNNQKKAQRKLSNKIQPK